MIMKHHLFRLSLILCLISLSVSVFAQKLTVESFALAADDQTAATSPRLDINKTPCALIRVKLAKRGVTFEGNIIGEVVYKNGEYHVYLTSGTQMLNIKHSDYLPLMVNFRDYSIRSVKSKCTYELNIKLPAEVEAPKDDGKRYMIINVEPATASIEVDGQRQNTTNGVLSMMVAPGNHTYKLQAEGYAPESGNIQVGKYKVQRNFSLKKLAHIDRSNTSDKETITINGVSFNMIRVDGGTFTMGTPEANSIIPIPIPDNEKPAHEVTLTTYQIAETPVTVGLWKAVMGSVPLRIDTEMQLRRISSEYPVTEVSWQQCRDFIRKLNQLTNKKFRLPTEAEWEFAARGGKKSKGYSFSGSDDFDTVGWNDIHEVKQKAPNELGIYDMSGNVGEWCFDYPKKYTAEPQTDPKFTNPFPTHVIRGKDGRVTRRESNIETDQSRDTGFRLAL